MSAFVSLTLGRPYFFFCGARKIETHTFWDAGASPLWALSHQTFFAVEDSPHSHQFPSLDSNTFLLSIPPLAPPLSLKSWSPPCLFRFLDPTLLSPCHRDIEKRPFRLNLTVHRIRSSVTCIHRWDLVPFLYGVRSFSTFSGNNGDFPPLSERVETQFTSVSRLHKSNFRQAESE